MTNQSAHTNRAGVKTNWLLIITEALGPKGFLVVGSQLFGRSGAHWYDAMSHPPVFHFNQATVIIERRLYVDRNIYLGSLESCT